MTTAIYLPHSIGEAAYELNSALHEPLEKWPKKRFVRAWCSLAYLFPGFHPDSFDEGWPVALQSVAIEAWRRADSGELLDEELYPSDAQWCGLYDQMFKHTDEETARRNELAAAFGRYN